MVATNTRRHRPTERRPDVHDRRRRRSIDASRADVSRPKRRCTRRSTRSATTPPTTSSTAPKAAPPTPAACTPSRAARQRHRRGRNRCRPGTATHGLSAEHHLLLPRHRQQHARHHRRRANTRSRPGPNTPRRPARRPRLGDGLAARQARRPGRSRSPGRRADPRLRRRQPLTYVVDGALGEDAKATAPRNAAGPRDAERRKLELQDIATPSSRSEGHRRRAAARSTSSSPRICRSRCVEPPDIRGTGTAAAPEGVTQATIYMRDNATGTYLPLVTEANTSPGTKFGAQQVQFAARRPICSHVVMTSKSRCSGRVGTGPVRVERPAASAGERAARPGAGDRPVELGYNTRRGERDLERRFAE